MGGAEEGSDRSGEEEEGWVAARFELREEREDRERERDRGGGEGQERGVVVAQKGGGYDGEIWTEDG